MDDAREERMELLRNCISAFKMREITPEWFVCFGPMIVGGVRNSSVHICKPRAWELMKESVRIGNYDPRVTELVIFSPFKDHACFQCGTKMPTWVITVGRLFILGERIK